MKKILLLPVFWLWAVAAQASAPQVGDMAPNWILPDQSGNPISLYQDVEPSPTTVMFFWASWCKSCKRLLPVIQQLDQVKGDRPIVFYLMNVWEDDDPMAFLKKYDIVLPVFLQAENVAHRYDIKITPGIVVIGPDRHIQYVRQPQDGVASVTEQLQRVLNITLEPAVGQSIQGLGNKN